MASRQKSIIDLDHHPAPDYHISEGDNFRNIITLLRFISLVAAATTHYINENHRILYLYFMAHLRVTGVSRHFSMLCDLILQV